ncbi:BTAD domain-containing putative transcriptional regulator [Actinokineospora sp. NBRC 105648]|uniref:BTAD domain-containing putative transcriptional regulator n=1 Tax=Actinokineospora sp. NBRC 105648 TaxID=3032206 RepID=UPI0025532E8B|nr:BTAD domain-containing putative transcriptional regulator [Actinokineospora sp. NBRC 105648]
MLARVLGRLVQGLGATAVLATLVVGIPWGLIHYIGWPLPDHVPRWDEIQATLLSPMSTSFLLNVLTCVLWPVWARFTWDVVASGVDAARLAQWPEIHTGPLRAVAGVLVGAIVFSVIGHRTPVFAPAAPTSDRPVASTAAAVSLVPGPSVRPLAFASQKVPEAEPRPLVAAPGTAVVRAPSGGVYDSLWRIAARELGNGARWPEIWERNRGHTQVDGRVFHNPNHIRPGWTFELPAPSDPPPAATDPEPEEQGQHTDQPPTPTTAPPSTPPAPTTSPRSTSESNAPRSTEHQQPVAIRPGVPHPGTGISVETGAHVGLALAALITTTLVTVRLRRRRQYRPGSGIRDEHTIAPIVRSLRIAYDHATLPRDDDGDLIYPDRVTSPADDLRRRAGVTATRLLPSDASTIVGVRQSDAVAVDLARARGLGLVGPGAVTAGRALVVGLLAANQHNDTVVVVPRADALALFGRHTAPERWPSELRVTEDLDSALDVLEAELLTRARQFDTSSAPTAMVLVATPTPHADRRLQAIIDNGSALGLAGVLFGQWRAGGTVRVRADGTVSATSPDLADMLAGTRLFTLPADDAAGLLALLGEATDPADRVFPPHPDTHGTTSSPLVDDEHITAAVDPEGFELPGHNVNDPGRRVPADAVTHPPKVHVDIPHAPPAIAPNEPSAPTELEQPPTNDSDKSPREVLPLELAVLGRAHLHHRGPDGQIDLIDGIAPKQREVLVYLALKRGGARRETLAAAIWPDAPPDRPYNSFHATLSQLRRAVRRAAGDAVGDLVVNVDGHYGLNPDLVSVDLWQLEDALQDVRRSHNQQEALRAITTIHRGFELGDGLISTWLDAPREKLRRDVLDALGALVANEGTVHEDQKLVVLEQIRGMDPYNEAVYEDIMRVQAQTGHHHAIPRTLALLTTTLAEIGEVPSRSTVALEESLRLTRPQTRGHPS